MPRRKRGHDHLSSVVSTANESDSSSSDTSSELRTHPQQQQPQQRDAANARERARMRVLSRAFCRLKTTLPWVPADTKLSKLDTLRLATSYIAHLRAVLTASSEEHDETNEDQAGKCGHAIGFRHPLTLTWPFSFQRTEQPSNYSAEREWLELANVNQNREKHKNNYY